MLGAGSPAPALRSGLAPSAFGAPSVAGVKLAAHGLSWKRGMAWGAAPATRPLSGVPCARRQGGLPSPGSLAAVFWQPFLVT